VARRARAKGAPTCRFVTLSPEEPFDRHKGNLYGASAQEGDLGLYCEPGTGIPVRSDTARAVEIRGFAQG
jgi:hypothetical protein